MKKHFIIISILVILVLAVTFTISTADQDVKKTKKTVSKVIKMPAATEKCTARKNETECEKCKEHDTTECEKMHAKSECKDHKAGACKKK